MKNYTLFTHKDLPSGFGNDPHRYVAGIHDDGKTVVWIDQDGIVEKMSELETTTAHENIQHEDWIVIEKLPWIQIIKTKQVREIDVIDPDSGWPVSITILKLETGGMVGIDSSFLENTELSVYSPFDETTELEVE